MSTEALALKKELEMVMDEQIPDYVSEKIIELIPSKYKNTEDPCVFISQVSTFGEYRSLLLLYDKNYQSRLHNYGIQERLLFSYRDIEPGCIKDYRLRTLRGTFKTENDCFQASGLEADQSNIILIQVEEWDSNLYDGKKTTFDIIVYNQNNLFEQARKIQASTVIKNLKEELQKVGDLEDGK